MFLIAPDATVALRMYGPATEAKLAQLYKTIDQLLGEKPEDAPSIKVEFKKGDPIKIREGAFENFEGVVDSIDPERGIVKVIVTIFGRSTPLDIEYWQVEKL